MPTLSRYFAQTAVERLYPKLSLPIKEAIASILTLLDENGQVTVGDILDKLFPLATTASANSMFNRLVSQFNEQTEKAGTTVKLQVMGAKNLGIKRLVSFEGAMAISVPQNTPQLDAISSHQMIDDQRGMPLEPCADIVLITFNEHETAAVIKAFHPHYPPTQTTKDGISYNHLGTVGAMSIVHTVSQQGGSTVGGITSTTFKAIQSWRPKAIIAVGIAFGINSQKQHIGDVLVSTQIQNYELARVNSNGSVTPRGDRVSASTAWVNRIRTTYETECQHFTWPLLHFGLVLSGEKLVDNVAYRMQLHQLFPDAIGGEMEGNGLYVAASDNKCDWLVIKGICDWADGYKNDNKMHNQQLAAENAAKVLHYILAKGPLYDPSELQSTLMAKKEAPHKTAQVQHMGINDLCNVPNQVLQCDTQARLASLKKDQLDELSTQDHASVEVIDYLLAWLNEKNAPSLFALLGEYGMGKTITCQRLARELEQRRAQGENLPLPLYFDLRNLTGLNAKIPTWQETLLECIERGWSAPVGYRPNSESDLYHLLAQGVLVILDGLDEALVKLNQADGQTFTNGLLKLILDINNHTSKDNKSFIAPRLLISCRTQYFRTLREQQTYFTGQERSPYEAEAYRALVLLPFSDEQIRHYLQSTMPEANIEQLMNVVCSVHDMQDLARRPYTLKLLSEFIPQIEQARAAGKTIRGVTLYKMVAQRWLDRDQGKHHIKPEHKLRLATHLAAALWRSGGRILSVQNLESWFGEWLESQTDLKRRYQNIDMDQLEEDLRTATFLTRHDGDTSVDSGFRFAHSSLQEYFLACYLQNALEINQPKNWDMPKPSLETFDFLGQLFQEDNSKSLINNLQNWRFVYRKNISENIFAYALRAHIKRWPMPILRGMVLTGAQLNGWQIGVIDKEHPKLNLQSICFAQSDLRYARFYNVNLEYVKFTQAYLTHVEFHSCILVKTFWSKAIVEDAIFRYCNLQDSLWDDAKTCRSEFVFCQNVPNINEIIIIPILTNMAFDKKLTQLNGHEHSISLCLWSPDGSKILSASNYDGLRVWDVQSGQCLRALDQLARRCISCSWSPDGSKILSTDNYSLNVIDANSGYILKSIAGNYQNVASCMWSPDGSKILSTDDNSLRVFDAHTGECLRSILRKLHKAMWSPDGSFIINASHNRVDIWDVCTGKSLKSFESSQGLISCCVCSPDGLHVAIISGSDLMIWDFHSEFKLLENDINYYYTHCVWSPDGSKILTLCQDSLKIWDVLSNQCVKVVNNKYSWRKSPSWSPDGSQILITDFNNLEVYDANLEICQRKFISTNSPIRNSMWSIDGSQVFSISYRGLMAWDAYTGECLKVFMCNFGTAKNYLLSPDGLSLLIHDDNLRVFDIRTGKCLKYLRKICTWQDICQWSPDNKRIIVVSQREKIINIYDIYTGEYLNIFDAHQNNIIDCKWSPDGSKIISFSHGSLRVWDSYTGECLKRFKDRYHNFNICEWSPNGLSVLLSSDFNGIMKVFDINTGKCLKVFEGLHNMNNCAAWSPDGSKILSVSDNDLIIWDTDTTKGLKIRGDQGHISNCAWSPDGSKIISTGHSGVVKLWDIASCKSLYTFYIQGLNDYAVWKSETNQIIEATGEVWRTLKWVWLDETGVLKPHPLESFGELPKPKRLIHSYADNFITSQQGVTI